MVTAPFLDSHTPLRHVPAAPKELFSAVERGLDKLVSMDSTGESESKRLQYICLLLSLGFRRQKTRMLTISGGSEGTEQHHVIICMYLHVQALQPPGSNFDAIPHRLKHVCSLTDSLMG